MHTGSYISAIAHGLLIAWALFGGLWLRADEPLPVRTTDVTLLSSAEFEALSQPREVPPTAPAPAPVTEAPDVAPVPPDESAAALPPPEAQPESLPAPSEEAPPDAPEADPLPTTEAAPPPAPRVAPEAAPEPAPDAEIAPEVVPEVAPAESPDAAAEVDPQPAAAPQAATTEIVTEAEKTDSPVIERSLRPVARPKPPAPVQAEATPSPAEESPEEAPRDAIAEALASAVEETPAPATAAASGPPLTGGERDAFRLAVSGCWVVDVGSPSADVTVTVGFSLDQAGKVVGGSLRLVGAEGGSGTAVDVAFQAARRAILRCQRDGYPLPADKYAQWREVEMTFNPKDMRIK